MNPHYIFLFLKNKTKDEKNSTILIYMLLFFFKKSITVN